MNTAHANNIRNPSPTYVVAYKSLTNRVNVPN